MADDTMVPGRLGQVWIEGEQPRREDLVPVLDELDHQMACQGRDTDLDHSDDGSVDLWYGPAAPEGGRSNWVQTIRGRHWFACARSD
jgi:Protein of unknown function (DUF1214)